MHTVRIHAEHDIAVSSLLFSKNVHPRFVQELLGHASVAITLDTYAQMVPGMGRQAVDAIGEALE
jgi:integrase